MFYRVVRALFRAVAAVMFRFSVAGVEQVPASGPAIVVAPHRSWLDPACVGAACPRPVRFLIMDTVYQRSWSRWFYRRMGSIPVPRGAWASAGALRSAMRSLRRGELVGIFPEGRVVSHGARAPIHAGAALLAVRAGAPVIPMAIQGSAKAWPHGRLFPAPARVSVRIGWPIHPPSGVGADAVREMLARIEGFLRES